MISIVISTKNRLDQLKKCLRGLIDNTYKDFEIIIVNQGDDRKIRTIISRQRKIGLLIKYFRFDKGGLARARNFGIRRSRGDVITFTDDDCITDKDWLKNIYLSFQKYKNIVGVFGKVFPFKPKLNKNKICPCTFLNNKERVIIKPCLHLKYIGFGNNMAFRKEIFDKIGGFKTWLGPGSIGSNAEDAEFALRCLLKGYKILYDPQVIVYHNRWLSKEEYCKQYLSYSCGEVACYGYFAFQGHKFAKSVIKNNFKDSYKKFIKSFQLIFSFKKYGLRLFFYSLKEFYFRLRGFIVGWYFRTK